MHLSLPPYSLRFARGLHVRLLVMHALAVIGQCASTAKYLLPVSNTSCTVTYEMMVAMALLFNVSTRPVVVPVLKIPRSLLVL